MAVVHSPDSDSHGKRPEPIALKAARDLIRRRIMPLPVPYGTKNPSDRKGWQTERYTTANLSAFNVPQLNIGMRLGHITAPDGSVLTDRFVDVDLDCPEAVRAAMLGILPPTDMIWGRASNPRSHYGYRLQKLDGAHSVTNFNDPLNPRDSQGKSDARICELRFTGQTIAPGSVNMESGTPEKVRWETDGDGDPGEVAFEELERTITYLYAVALLARYWRDGIRHDATLPLAGLLVRGGMPEAEALRYVEYMCRTAGETGADLDNRLGCVRDTYAKAQQNLPYTGGPTLEDYIDKRVVDKIRRALNLKRTTTSGDIGPDGISLSDLGNAERFALRFEGRALYCDDQSQWYIYENGVWLADRQNRVQAMVKELLREFRALASDPTRRGGNASQQQIDRHIQEWQRARGISATLTLARSELAVLPEQFDGDPWLLNCKNGTIQLAKDGSHYVREHRWQDLLTKRWEANYNPDASAPALDWYRRTFVPEDDRWEFLEEALGYSLNGLPKRYNFQLLGPSNAGKSMWLRFLKVHAGGYGASLKYTALKPDAHGGGDKPRSDLLSLRGARLLTIAEVDGGTVFDTTLFKTMLSGGDATTVRGAYEKRGQTFSFTVSLWTSGNDAYGADTDDDAAYERVHVIKFEHPMPKGNRDDSGEDDVVNPANTGDAFLAAALRGFTRLYRDKGGRLQPPDDIVRATAAMREELDPFKPIADQMIEITGDPNHGVLKSQLADYARAAYELEPRARWGYGTARKFFESLERRGAKLTQARTRFNNRDYLRGARWTEEFQRRHGNLIMPDWQAEK